MELDVVSSKSRLSKTMILSFWLSKLPLGSLYYTLQYWYYTTGCLKCLCNSHLSNFWHHTCYGYLIISLKWETWIPVNKKNLLWFWIEIRRKWILKNSFIIYPICILHSTTMHHPSVFFWNVDWIIVSILFLCYMCPSIL